jgi:predicted TIM-barrel fold metal-dependent hydrolase
MLFPLPDSFVSSSLLCLSALFFSSISPPITRAQENIPKSQLNVTETLINHASFPVVDVHTHFFVKGKHDPQLLDKYVEFMDRNNIAVSVSLDATLQLRLQDHQQFLWTQYRDRFVLFANIDFRGKGTLEQPETWDCNQSDFVRTIVEELKSQVALGTISGLKLFKDFGLRYRNADGSLIAIDDARFDPIWKTCGDLKIPVIIHTADPNAFFEPIDEANERFRELQVHPDWSFYGSDYPARSDLHAARNRVIEKHSNTTFIAAHFGNDAENLLELADWLNKYPNLVIEFSSRINELGRQPFSAKRFFETYQDRIMFGTDGPWPEERLRIYWRFLETQDEYFLYSEKKPQPQGDWRIYGLNLSQNILKKIYSGNANRLIPGVKQRVETFERKNQRPNQSR